MTGAASGPPESPGGTMPPGPARRDDRSTTEVITALPGHRAQRLAELERQIAEVWADVLGLERVGPADDFFELGGNSLHAVHIVSRTEEIVGVSLSSRSVLESRNVHEMAAHVWRVQDAANDSGS